MKAYFLPHIEVSEEEQVIGNLGVSLPNLSPDQLIELSSHLLSAQEKLAEVSAHDIVHWIAGVCARWADSHDPIRREAEMLLPQACGLSTEMVRVVLDDLFGALTEAALHQLLERELGDARRLDEFCPNKNGTGRARAFGPRLMTQILPGNTLGVSVVSLVLGLLVKSANLMRVSREEMMLTTLFAQSLKQHWPEGAETMAVLTWDKTQVELSKAAFQKSDLVMVYGSDETIAAVREIIPPAKKAIFHGHKLSLGVIARECVCRDLAQKAAMDVALYDQRGCLSPQVYYVESGGETPPLEFARQVAEALDVLSWTLPKGASRADEASRIQQLRGTLPLKGGVVFQSFQGVGWTVLYDLKPEFRLSPLSRTLWIKPMDDLSSIASLLEPVRQVIQAIGIAAPKERAPALVEGLSKVGGCRFCAIGEMQRPPLSWYHDGASRLLPLLRFVEWENQFPPCEDP